MRKLLVLALALIVFSGCAATNMITQGVSPNHQISPDTAKLYIIRDTSFGFAIAVSNYLDRKLIGQTKGGTYLIAEVPPGTHYVVASSENTMGLKFDFEKGKRYFLRQDIWPGLWRAQAGLSPYSLKEAEEAMGKCTYMEYDRNNPGEDLDGRLFDQVIRDYEKGVINDPAGYKASLEYKGY